MAIDTETTGLNPAAGHRVVDLAVVLVENGKVVLEWQTFIDPGPDAVWTREAEEVNKISLATVAGAPTAAEAWAKFVEWTNGLPIAAHNVAFDSAFVANELKLAGLPAQTNTWHCTMMEAGRRRWPKLGALYFTYAQRWIRNILRWGMRRRSPFLPRLSATAAEGHWVTYSLFPPPPPVAAEKAVDLLPKCPFSAVLA